MGRSGQGVIVLELVYVKERGGARRRERAGETEDETVGNIRITDTIWLYFTVNTR